MANTKSAIKAARKTARFTARNKVTKTRLKTLHKKFETAAKSGDAVAAKAAASDYASAMDIGDIAQSKTHGIRSRVGNAYAV